MSVSVPGPVALVQQEVGDFLDGEDEEEAAEDEHLGQVDGGDAEEAVSDVLPNNERKKNRLGIAKLLLRCYCSWNEHSIPINSLSIYVYLLRKHRKKMRFMTRLR